MKKNLITKILLIFLSIKYLNGIEWNDNWAFGCDFQGNELSSVVIPADKCSSQCSQTPECTHFTWTTWNGGTCWMKKGSVSKNNAFETWDKSMICGVIIDGKIQWNGNWAFGCDFKNNDLTSSRFAGDQCSNECSKNSECTHFTWTNFNGGTCWMKKGSVSKNDAFSVDDKTIVCGILDLPGENIEELKGALVWSDEFDSMSSFSNNWNQETGGHGWGNNELQFYTINNHNVEISNGMLTIHTRKENYGNREYTSARLMSRNKFRHGVFEMRARLPYGRGTWSAFWLLASKRPLAWPKDGEIDIMEHVGYQPNLIHATIHCGAHNHMDKTQIGKELNIDDAFNKFHLYQIYWSSQTIKGYVDGKYFFEYKRPANSNYNNWPYDNEFNIVLNTAFGGDWGGAMGIDNNILPQKYVIDYVRVWNAK
ncbi:unnamed protein product [Brachionus calyciflorus]|uniref:GH16 domain-containing protein n=1 Tax=Brachionus calyciflorus TaxID=104777 RepID=A0A814P323_9BILA|nr:unnamed protein product [Brachionus calyciflorus]